jgi:hypothetical protein
MDLLSIVRKIWHYKLATAPVIALTIVGVAYVVAIKSPVYEATGSYLLINPPDPPTDLQIEGNPELGKINPSNPYTRLGDTSVVIDILARTMRSAPARKELARAGASPDYTVMSAAHFGMTSPIVQITARAPTPEAAIRTATVVGHAVVSELDRMQKIEDVNPRYRIKAMAVDVPHTAELRASGQLRLLVGVGALGAVLLFVVVSVFDALAKLQVERRARNAVGDDLSWTQGTWHPPGDVSELGSDGYPIFNDEELARHLSTDFHPDPAPASEIDLNGRAYGGLPSPSEERRSNT